METTKHSLAELERLILENYAARERGELPDEWFWADREALARGYAIDESGTLQPIMR